MQVNKQKQVYDDVIKTINANLFNLILIHF